MRYLLGVAALFVLPATVTAQTWQQGTPVTSAAHAPRYYTAAEEALAAIRARLRELVGAQEEHFLANRTYTTNLNALRLPAPEKALSQVVLEVTHAGGRAWQATGRHPALLGTSCAIFVGDVESLPILAAKVGQRRPRGDQEGVVVCQTR